MEFSVGSYCFVNLYGIEKKPTKIILIVLGSMLLILVPLLLSYRQPTIGSLKISFLDIGQGDAILIETPDHRLILVDGGPNDAVLNALSKVLSFWQKTFDLIILTNPDRDHMDGLLHVLDRYTVKKFLVSGVWKKNAFTKGLLEKISSKKVPLLLARSDEDFSFGDVTLDILFPPRIFTDEDVTINNGSVVFMLRFHGHRIMFPGDAEVETETWIAKNIPDIRAEILKAGHHGSKTSSSEIFLQKVQPKVTIISCGKRNRYGHPHEITLERLKKVGSKILRTDELGTVQFTFDY